MRRDLSGLPHEAGESRQENDYGGGHRLRLLFGCRLLRDRADRDPGERWRGTYSLIASLNSAPRKRAAAN